MNCIFCKIVAGTVPSSKVYENDEILAFHDIAPVAPMHIVIIPKKHIETMNDVKEEDLYLIAEVHKAAKQIAIDLGIAESGYRLVSNCGQEGGQVVYHIHYHLLGGTRLGPILNLTSS
jgi:histidine triad (HIT) family protein